MEKLVKLARLERPENPYGHITENQHLSSFDKPGWILNPLHTAVIGTKIEEGLNFREIALRFGQINASLRRSEMVTIVCVLGKGAAWYEAKGTNAVNATYMWDRDTELLLAIHDNEPDNAFYRYFTHLETHLNRSVLNTTAISISYGQSVAKYYTYPVHGASYNAHVRGIDGVNT